MNKKYFIILLVFFFITHIKKIHGCHASGNGCINHTNRKCGAQVVDANLLPNSVLNMTVQSPNDGDKLGVSAIGHFSMNIDDGRGGYYFFKKPQWVNGCGCNHCDHIPLQYTFQENFGLATPPKGTWFDIWISIYWQCVDNGGGSGIGCTSEDVHYRGYVK